MAEGGRSWEGDDETAASGGKVAGGGVSLGELVAGLEVDLARHCAHRAAGSPEVIYQAAARIAVMIAPVRKPLKNLGRELRRAIS